jgi:hypothetical protein
MGHREEHFARIARYYQDRYSALEQAGDEPYRFTTLGAWAASRAPQVFHFFHSIQLSRFRLFVDLGSGDGLVACLAGLFTRAVGIEVDERLCRESLRATRCLGLEERVRFLCADYLTQNFRQADCLYIYPDKPFYALEAMLDGWEGTLLAYGPHFPPKALVPMQRLQSGAERLVLYRCPTVAHATAGTNVTEP